MGFLLPSALLTLVIVLAGVIRPTHFHESIPLTAITKLKETGVRGTIYCHYAYGGPLIDAGYPEWKVAYDGRYYRYTPEEWEHYLDTIRGESSLAEVDRVYQPVAYFLRPGTDNRLIAELRANRSWREVYADSRSAVFVRSP